MHRTNALNRNIEGQTDTTLARAAPTPPGTRGCPQPDTNRRQRLFAETQLHLERGWR